MSAAIRVFAPRFVGRRDEMSQPTLEPAKAGDSSPRSFVGGLADSDLVASFLSQKIIVAAGAITLVLVLAAIFAPWVAPTNPFNPATNFLIDSLTPPRMAAPSTKSAPPAPAPQVAVAVIADSSLKQVLQELAQAWADTQDSGPQVPLTLTNAGAAPRGR